MFKKEFSERSKGLLKNKEVRNLQQQLLSQFKGLNAADLGTLFSGKAQISQSRFGSKDVLYSNAEGPIAFDVDGRNDLLPTVFFLSWFPTAVRVIEIHSMVSEYLLNGADLMMPGVLSMEGL
jgi:predicted ribosome-associated RNA-binding protein Tma20